MIVRLFEVGEKFERRSWLILMIKDESESPTDEILIVLLDAVQVPKEALHVVLDVIVKSGEGAIMETDVNELRKDECIAKGELIVIVIFEFSLRAI